MKHSRLLFKDLEQTIQALRKEKLEFGLNPEDFSVELQNVTNRLDALLRVLEYVNSYKWLKKAEAVNKIKMIRASRYDYTKIMDELEMTESALKSFMRYCNKQVKSKVGTTTIQLISEGSLNTGIIQFETLTGTYSLEKLLVQEAYEKLPPAKFKPVNLLECKAELQFLCENSKEAQDKKFSMLDMEKLSFLRYILSEDSPKYAVEKRRLVGLLAGSDLTFESFFSFLESNAL